MALNVSREPPELKDPLRDPICLVDRVRFCFFSFSARNSLFSLAKIVAPCIASWKPLTSWFNARSDGLGGLRDPVRSKDLIDEACRRTSFSVEGVLGVKLRLDSLPRLGGGVGVRR